MRVALVNPCWSYDGSIYFGCREPHLPLELGYSRAQLEADGHEVLMLDGQIQGLDNPQLAARVADFAPDMTVVTTAPTYLFWRCAPPELRVPAEFLAALDDAGGRTVAVGPHGSATPGPTLHKLGVDIVVRGECEEVVAELANSTDWTVIGSTAYLGADGIARNGPVHVSKFVDHPALRWPDEWVQRHSHHHHRFDDLREVSARRSKPRAAAPTIAASAPRSTSATPIGGAITR